jgi:hypothetical protein
MTTRHRTGRTREDGFALLMTVMLLLVLASLAFAGLETVQRDQQVAGHLNRKRIALNAADAGIAKGLETLTLTGTPVVPTTTLGDTGLYPQGRPRYMADTSDGPAVENLGTGGVGGYNLQPTQNGAPQFQMQYYKIRVEGRAPGGSRSRVEFATGSIVAN